MKVETHNHPTAISPFPGAATGSGGEIRDEGATGRGAKPKAGLVGFTVSHLELPGLAAAVGTLVAGQAGSHRVAAVDHARRADRRRELQQRVRPAEPRGLLPHELARGGRRLARLSQADHDRRRLGQHSRRERRQRRAGPRRQARRARRPGDADRPRRRRGVVAGQRRRRSGSSTSLRCSAATPRCSGARKKSSTRAGRLGADNPIAAIHDIGAGGLSNAVPEIVDHSGCGAEIELRADPERRARHEPDGALVQRVARALHADDRAARRRALRCASASASVARTPCIGELTAKRDLVVRDSDARRRAGCDADGSAVRQTAEDDSGRGAASRSRRPNGAASS